MRYPPKLGHAHHGGQDRHGAVGGSGAVGHGSEPIADVLDGDGVHGHVAERGQDVVADEVSVGHHGPGLPVPGVAVEELVGELGHRLARRSGSAARLPRVEEGAEEPASFAPRLGHGHGVRASHLGIAPAPAHHARQEECFDAGGLYRQPEAGDHVVADFVFPVAGLGGADALGEGGFEMVGHGQRLLCRTARPGGSTGSGRGGVSPREPCGGAGRDEP